MNFPNSHTKTDIYEALSRLTNYIMFVVMDKKVLLFEEQIIIYINIFSQKSEIYVT